jgi:hypothetical protein
LNSQSAIGQCHGLEFRLQAIVSNDQPDRLKAELQTKNDIVFSMVVPGRSRCVGNIPEFTLQKLRIGPNFNFKASPLHR